MIVLDVIIRVMAIASLALNIVIDVAVMAYKFGEYRKKKNAEIFKKKTENLIRRMEVKKETENLIRRMEAAYGKNEP